MDRPSPMLENALVYACADGFAAVGEISRDPWKVAGDAGEVIQFALDRVGESHADGRMRAGNGVGGAVRLQRGTYPLARPLRVGANVNLVGCGRGTVLSVSSGCAAGVVIDSVRGACVSELAVHGGLAGAALDSRAAVGIDVANAAEARVVGVLAQGFARHGIRVRDNTILSRITDCSLADNGESNLKLERLDVGPFGHWIPNAVSNCTVFGGGKGVEIERCLVLTIRGVQVHQCTGCAFHAHSVSNAVSLVGCRTYQISGDAVLWEKSHEVSLVGNVFSWHTERGVVLRGCRWGTISGNNVIDTGSINPGGELFKSKFADLAAYPPSFAGIRLEGCRGLTVSGNAIFQWPVVPPLTSGVEEDEACADNLIAGNNVNFYRHEAVDARGRATVSAAGGGSLNAGYGPSPFYFNPPPGERVPLYMNGEQVLQSFDPGLTRGLMDAGYGPVDVGESE